MSIDMADDTTKLVLNEAMWAFQQGTFAVGGCIVDNCSGRVIHSLHNNVLKVGSGNRMLLHDPTAHGERQLIFWYYENKFLLGLPEPENLTILTSLDPCVMCAGALLATGFNVGVLGMDTFAGINYDGTFSFTALPVNLRNVAKSKFGYYGCGDLKADPPFSIRKYVGGENVAYKAATLSAQTVVACSSLFESTVERVRAQVSGKDANTVEEEFDPAQLGSEAPVIARFRTIYPDAFTKKIPDGRLPNAALKDMLVAVRDAEPGADNAVAFVDRFGNIVLCMADTFSKSPIHTAFMNVVRAYSIARFDLLQNENTRAEASTYLAHPKHGTFVFLHAPSPDDATTVMDLGAYGSTMEGPLPKPFPPNFQYYNPPLRGSAEQLRRLIMNLPYFYTSLVQMSAMEVALPNNIKVAVGVSSS